MTESVDISSSRTLGRMLALIFAATLGLAGITIMAYGGPGDTHMAFDWAPSIGVSLHFRLDGLSQLFALIISLIGACIFAYSAAYMQSHAHPVRFLVTLFCFALSMLGLVLADDVILLFIFWELTGLTSYLLIGTHHTSEIARRNALQALLVTGSAGLALLVALVWMASLSSSYQLSDMLASPELIQQSSYITAIMLLVMVGCFAKSAQFPLHFWLPSAMAAPTPVSAYLHSATMVKAGIYLLARLQPLFSTEELWTPLLACVGGLTMLWASLQALKQDDMKLLLAYTSIMALGALTLMLAFPTHGMAVATMAFMLAHALYKAALFMMAGIIEKHAGTRRLSELSGLGAHFPYVQKLALAAALSMAGIPLFFGFIAKETLYAASIEYSGLAWLGVIAYIFANALMMLAAYLVAVKPFRGENSTPMKISTAPALLLWIPAAIPATVGVLLGTFPALVDSAWIQPAASSLVSGDAFYRLSLWHGFTGALALSLITLALGALCVRHQEKALAMVDRITGLCRWQAETGYFALLTAINHRAQNVHHALHFATPHFYVRALFATLGGALLTALLITHDIQAIIPSFPPLPDWIGVSLSALAVTGAWVASRATSKIMALASLGASGFAMAGIFLLHGALDVAMTQLLVETLVVVLAAAVLWRHPDFSETAQWDANKRKADMLVAAFAGLAIYLALCAVLTGTLDLSVTYFYENASFALAHGQNIVNVIIVDFRAFDTFGEAMVIAIAAIGLWAIMQKHDRQLADEDTP